MTEAQKAPQTEKEKASYAIGVNLGKNMKLQGLDISSDVLIQGIRDELSGHPLALTDKEMEGALEKFQKEMMAKSEAKKKIDSDNNKKAGEAFLAANKKKPGVVTLPSGLQYKIITKGTGPKPKATSTVKVHYRGTLLDGTEFDSSYKRKQPIEFPVNQVIKGWTEAMQLMPTGSKWELFIPSNLAYGEQGGGQLIGPDATLIFEVELLSFK
jgi:FKBP-type peptidyl-prolyl cis-trans isomerase FklB